MNDKLIIIALVAAVAGIVLLIAKLTSFGRAFAEKARYICYEMDWAGSYEEYRRWRGELRCHYLCLIPFVSEKNVMRVYRLFFHRGDHAKKEERKDSLVPLLMPSILGVCICLVCVCGMTWAWYSANLQTSPQKMTAAYYTVVVESVTDKTANTPVAHSADGSYDLATGNAYSITLKASGSVTECGGYCLIERGDAKYYTQSFKANERITIDFTPGTGGAYTFTGVWGSHPIEVTAAEIINAAAEGTEKNPADEIDNSVISDDPSSVSDEPTEDQTDVSDTYTVQPGDTLATIADKYNTTAEKLAAYNGITDANPLHVGQIIKIPPEDWEIPNADSISLGADGD